MYGRVGVVGRQATQKRGYAIGSSPVTYSRVGDQVAVAPLAQRTSAGARLDNGVRVAALDGRGAASSVALVINAGTRHEASLQVAHVLKATLVRARPSDTFVRTVREFELRGNTLHTALSRENLLIGSSFLRDDLVDVVPALVSNVFNPSFHAYELLDALPLIAAETQSSLADPITAVEDALHQTAFRRGLGRTLFANDASLHKVTRADLKAFAEARFTADNIVLVGTGVSPDELVAQGNKAFAGLALSTGSGSSAYASGPTTYFGGETRLSAPGTSSARFVIGFKGVGLADGKAHATQLVLRALLEGAPRAKWGSASGLLGRATADNAVLASAFSTTYSDAGLFGLNLVGPADHIASVAKKAISALQSAASSVSDADLRRAHKAAIVDAEFGSTSDELTADIAKQVLVTGSFLTAAELASAISSVTAADLVSAAQALLSSKASVVAYGDLNKLPYADEL
ncbi:ubiquinol-cytochrome c reductase core subunit 1 [Physocladia obscura]|uniref:Cytochrome b-c1 complex subunit 2, mitochondrial n=1 Tax=Physocladia obscura TaxID=109957 RepID=A0AAD5XC96_9FUNG|nr:ubiquinol-cytochrome c reductase core subunit 1 [Physocladia obscura]